MPPAAPPPVLHLPLARSDEALELGGKGNGVDRLLAACLPVPPTAVVTASTYRRFAADVGVRAMIEAAQQETVPAATVDAAFLVAPIDDALAGRIVTVASEVAAGGRLAVRSSAHAEDTASLSFAGQYHSVLGVEGDDPADVLRAVRLTWASLWHPAPVAYRRAWGVPAADAVMSVGAHAHGRCAYGGRDVHRRPGWPGRPDASRGRNGARQRAGLRCAHAAIVGAAPR